MLLQIENLQAVLSEDGVTVIGLLLCVCIVFGWYILRQDKRLLAKESEEQANKAFLIKMAEKHITATEQNTTALNGVKDAIDRIK